MNKLLYEVNHRFYTIYSLLVATQVTPSESSSDALVVDALS
jgi:hypothetical protein